MAINRKTESQIAADLVDFIKSRYPSADLIPNTVLRDLLVEGPARLLYDNQFISSFYDAVTNFNTVKNMLNSNMARLNLANALSVDVSVIDMMIANIINLYAENYNLTRKVGNKATGILTFYKVSGVPETAMTIPAGTTCSVPGTNLKFITRTSVTMPANPTIDYYDSVSNVYRIRVEAEALGVGTVYNVGSGLITSSGASSVPLSVTNSGAFVGGLDAETDLELLQRVKLVYTGNFKGTAPSILSRILETPFVQDASIAYKADDPNKRRSGLSQIDVFVRAQGATTYSDSALFNGNPHPLTKTWVTDIDSITINNSVGITSYSIPAIFYQVGYDTTAGTSSVTFIENIEQLSNAGGIYYASDNYQLIMPSGSANVYVAFKINGLAYADAPTINTSMGEVMRDRYTIRLADGTDITDVCDLEVRAEADNHTCISIPVAYSSPLSNIQQLNISVHPKVGTDTVATTYNYNPNMELIEQELHNDAYEFIGQDIMVYPADAVTLYMKATVQVDPSVSIVEKTAEIQSAVTAYLTRLSMGASVEMSAVIDVILSIPGVTDVRIPFDLFGIQTDPAIPPIWAEDVQLSQLQYIGFVTAQITLTKNIIRNTSR